MEILDKSLFEKATEEEKIFRRSSERKRNLLAGRL